MTDLLVSVDGLGKKFCRSLRRSLWYGVRDVAGELAGRRGGNRELRKDEFWALRDVTFQLRRGETLGLIGHNGAGKTTLLRLLTGLIKPDAGRIELRGRLQALIALGAGFNPLLTGRENVYVNASILGVRKRDIDRLFETIVEFAGVEEALDMPVQSYSSGMVVRLGFSVAAHLEPDILLVDEVLAVGDLAFRTKCQVRIGEMQQRGVAIILVSHNLHTISHVCRRAMALDRGSIIYDGDPDTAIDTYRESLVKRKIVDVEMLRGGTGEIRIHRVEILNLSGRTQTDWRTGDTVTFRLHYTTHSPVEGPVFNIVLHVLNGVQVTGFRTDIDGLRLKLGAGSGSIDVDVPHLNLLPNVYTVDAVIFHEDGVTFYDRVNHLASLKVVGGHQINGTTYMPHYWRADSLQGTAARSVS